MLLSEWSSGAARDVIDLNRKKRTKQHPNKKVRFTLPSMALDAVGGRRGRTLSKYEIRSSPAVTSPAATNTPPRNGNGDSAHRSPSRSGTDSPDHLLIPEDVPSDVTTTEFDLNGWLNSIHMSRYEPTFRKNGFESRESVQLLSEDDLDLMGIRIQRHRVLLLRESARLL